MLIHAAGVGTPFTGGAWLMTGMNGGGVMSGPPSVLIAKNRVSGLIDRRRPLLEHGAGPEKDRAAAIAATPAGRPERS